MIVEKQPPIRTRDIRRHDDVARAAELEQNVAGIDQAGRQRRGDVVGGPSEDGQPLGQSGLRDGFGRDDAENALGIVQRGES